jgi:hypothetical protein
MMTNRMVIPIAALPLVQVTSEIAIWQMNTG